VAHSQVNPLSSCGFGGKSVSIGETDLSMARAAGRFTPPPQCGQTSIGGVYMLNSPRLRDDRGFFRKPFSRELFKSLKLEYNFAEFFYSLSNKNVIRGMHFQKAPMECTKLVSVIAGTILDVCLDLRKSSKTFAAVFACELSEENEKSLYVPEGIAHGFAALSENAVVHYAQSASFSKGHDAGIRYDSFGFDWPIKTPVVSEKDLRLPLFEDYIK
jgi:dTDP-4-dehydrorhamnose 3,5-epimerase